MCGDDNKSPQNLSINRVSYTIVKADSRSAIRFNRLLPLIALGGGQVSLVRDFWSKLPSGGGPEYTAIFAEEPLDILYRHRLGEQEALDG